MPTFLLLQIQTYFDCACFILILRYSMVPSKYIGKPPQAVLIKQGHTELLFHLQSTLVISKPDISKFLISQSVFVTKWVQFAL